MSLIIFDNRTCKYDSFDQEASTASYLTNSAEWIIKFALMSRGCIHSVGGSCHLAVAKNINSASLSELDLTQPNVKKLMTNVVTSECSPLVLSQGTYGFIRDAISKFYKALKNSKLPHSLRILIITTDVHLFHLANAEVYKEIGLFDQLIGAAPHGNISVHLMCSMVTEVTTACASTTYRERALHTASVAFESLGPYFTFSVFPNSPIYFSIELTNWFSSVLNPVLVTILLPACGSVKASVSVLLKGIDTRSNEWLYSFPDMRTLAVQCKVGRGSIDPLHLKGINFVVTAPVNAGSTVPLHQ